MTRSSKRTTSMDVARAAGVSRTTVSFVLNRRPGQSIPEETRRRVLDAARRLDYRPHASARTLAAGRSDIVLLSIPDLPIGQSISRFVEQLATALSEHGLTMVTHLAGAGGRTLPDVCAAVGASAVIGFDGFDREGIDALHRAGAEVVLTAEAATTPAMHAVGRAQAEHLIARGHRRLGYALPAHPRLVPMANARHEGVRQACLAADLAPPVVLTTGLDTIDATTAVRRWTDDSVTGVCAFNDETALAVLAGARGRGLRVPEDLAVVGVDDIPTARLAAPPLTTVAFDLHEVGRHYAEQVAAALAGRPTPTDDSAGGLRLITRASA
jgi:DNA-binding LacI/PurR family transcriptional regulator